MDGRDDALPGLARLPRVLLLERRGAAFCRRRRSDVVRVRRLAVGVFEHKALSPVPFDRVQRAALLVIISAVNGGLHMVLLTAQAQHALAAEISGGNASRRRDDSVAAVQLRVRPARQDSFHFDVGQRDQVVLVESVNVQNGVPDLLDIDRARERDLLPREALRAHAMLCIPQVARRDRRVVADLLAHQARLVALFANLADEDLAQEGVERFLDAVFGVAAGVLLAAKGSEEPFQYGEAALGWVLLVGRRDEEIGVLDPVAGEFGCGLVC